jgi:hypothetical protein
MALAAVSSCSTSQTPADAGVIDVPPPHRDGGPVAYCDLPGSLRYAASGRTLVEGGRNAPLLAWLSLPNGFCAHYFGHVGTARQIRFAPGGELFVASPATPTSGGAPPGIGAIAVLYDDNHDGYADGDTLPHADGSPQALTLYRSGLSSTQGILFAKGFFYWQDTVAADVSPGGTAILRLPYTSGERQSKGTPEVIANIDLKGLSTWAPSSVHWPKTLDMADDGTIYVGNGGDQSDPCMAGGKQPFHGGILKIGNGEPLGGTIVARGFRNPISVRCQRGKNLCFAAELGLDGSEGEGGREKVVPIRPGDDWGFPCCATTGVPLPGYGTGTSDCSQVASESVSLEIGNTPFGIDFEPGIWSPPYKKDVFVVLHGQVGSWIGASILAIPTDSTGMPVMTSDLGTSSVDQFATGWDDGLLSHGRPAAISFAADGRAFIANDVTGDIFWIAPMSLIMK